MRSHPNHFPFASSHAWLVCAGAKGLHGGLWLLFAGIQEYLLENGAGLPPQNAPRAGKPPAANDLSVDSCRTTERQESRGNLSAVLGQFREKSLQTS